jgi:predicted TIM-barrel fold metal-dependent hydrolase
MSSNRSSAAAAVRTRLNHPVIDSDGHWVEFGPQVADYLRQVGGAKAVEGFKSRPTEDWHLTIPLKERRERRLDQPVWWGMPAKNTLDHATSMLPKLLYERLDDFGFDFVVLYPSMGLRVPFIAEAELRRVTCRAFNTFSADLFREYKDRLTPAAVIPMHTPEEAIDELKYVVGTLGFKVVMMTSLIRRPIKSSNPNPRYNEWLDMLAIDSEYDYDPVWAKCVELGVSPTFHSVTKGVGTRVSPSNAVYNHIGHFGVAGEAVCKALFLGGVTRRFPTLNFAFLEGGVGWACALYSDLIGHWKKRNPAALEDINPANVDRELLVRLFREYGGKDVADQAELLRNPGKSLSPRTADPEASLDDFVACGIEHPEDIRDIKRAPKTDVHRGSQRRTVRSKPRIERHDAGRDEYVIDAVELLKPGARVPASSATSSANERAAPELRLGRLQAIVRSSGYDNPRAFGLRGLRGREPNTGGSAQDYDRLVHQ